MLARQDLTTLFEDLRHLVDALGSSDLTVAESRVLLPQVCRVIGTIHGADAMGVGVDPESRACEGRRFMRDQAHAAIAKAPSELPERSFA
jgi:hypothetical protein